MRKQINNFLVILSLSLVLSPLLYRFLRERLPRNIPFILDESIFLGLVFVIVAHLTSIVLLISSSEQNSFSKFIKDILNKPVIYVFEFIFTNAASVHILTTYVWPYIKQVFTTMTTYKNYVLLELIPQTIILFSFLFDIFYFKCLSSFYNILIIGVAFVAHKYAIYFLQYALTRSTNLLDKEVILYRANLTALNIKTFFNDQMKQVGENKPPLEYIIRVNPNFLEEAKERLGPNSRLNREKFFPIMRRNINFNIGLNKIIYLYEKSRKKYKYVHIAIHLLYVIGWTYILVKSIHTLSFNNVVELLVIRDLIEPFSGLCIVSYG